MMNSIHKSKIKRVRLVYPVIFLFLLGTPISSTWATDEATVNKMLQQFEAKGILNKEQAKEAKQKLREITPEQWAQIKKQAEQIKKEGRIPASQTSNNIDAAAGLIDTKSPQFKKTMEDMRKIIERP